MATEKQKRAAKILLENPRKSVSAAMREAGYSPKTAVVPGELTKSKGWQELLDEYLPEELLQQKHREALEATRAISAITGNKANGQTVDFVDVPDMQTRLKAVELGYKVRGKMKENIEHSASKELIDALTGIKSKYQD